MLLDVTGVPTDGRTDEGNVAGIAQDGTQPPQEGSPSTSENRNGLKGIRLSETSETEKDNQCTVSFIGAMEKYQTSRNREQSSLVVGGAG